MCVLNCTKNIAIVKQTKLCVCIFFLLTLLRIILRQQRQMGFYYAYNLTVGKQYSQLAFNIVIFCLFCNRLYNASVVQYSDTIFTYCKEEKKHKLIQTRCEYVCVASDSIRNNTLLMASLDNWSCLKCNNCTALIY